MISIRATIPKAGEKLRVTVVPARVCVCVTERYMTQICLGFPF